MHWGIAAVNLREAEADLFVDHDSTDQGYVLESVAPSGEASISRIRSHVAFSDWSVNRDAAENLLALASVKMVTITVTESGYYSDPDGNLDLTHKTVADEIEGGVARSVYAYLAAALDCRRTRIGAPITLCCCDNIRQNGKMLRRNFTDYLTATGQTALNAWVQTNVTFPCSMVDRITPRSTPALSQEMSAITGITEPHPVMAEAFRQWVLEDDFATEMPDLAAVGVTVTNDVDPYEETKIRVLNGGHTCLAYLAALRGIETFDQAMQTPELFRALLEL